MGSTEKLRTCGETSQPQAIGSPKKYPPDIPSGMSKITMDNSHC